MPHGPTRSGPICAEYGRIACVPWSALRYILLMSVREQLLASVPDAPTTLEVRALLLESDTEVVSADGGAIVFSVRHRQAGIVGAPPLAVLERTLAAPVGWEVLSLTNELGPAWPWKRAVISALSDETRLARAALAARAEVKRLRLDELPQVPEVYAIEITRAMDAGVVMCARCEGSLASFAYASAHTETLFDVSIDTEESFRGRGLAKLAAAALIEIERLAGRRPVWGAYEDNEASLAVARALGFAPVGDLFVAEL
jgi:GNAT superfamily N-acetyltransferase